MSKKLISDKQPITVAMWSNDFDIHGISSVIINYCRNIDLQNFSITILAGTPINDMYLSECITHEVRVVELPSRKKNTLEYYMTLYSFLKREHFDIIHFHCNSATITPELIIARLCGIKVRIAHSHNTTCDNLKIHRCMYPLFRKLCTARFACGEAAGNWLFKGENFVVIPNGFETKKFVFSQSARKKIQMELNLEGKLVLGHVGKFNDQKNQQYLLKIFEKYAEDCADAVLLLVGTGPNFNAVKEMAEKHPFRDRIILYGETSAVAEMYSAMDLFVLPSKFEGLPVVLLEAQISGLPCIVSDKVTQEVDFGDIVWKSIEAKPEIWVKAINGVEIRTAERMDYCAKHYNRVSEYEISVTVNKLEQEYLRLYHQRIKG